MTRCVDSKNLKELIMTAAAMQVFVSLALGGIICTSYILFISKKTFFNRLFIQVGGRPSMSSLLTQHLEIGALGAFSKF